MRAHGIIVKYEIIHIWTAVMDESEELIIAVNFQFKRMERRSPKKSGLQQDSNPWPRDTRKIYGGCYNAVFPLNTTDSGCFQVVDMRWGVRDDATNTHMTTELCLREIKACQEISVGPNFVVSAPLMFTKLTPT